MQTDQPEYLEPMLELAPIPGRDTGITLEYSMFNMVSSET